MDESVKKDIEATEKLLSAEETIMAYYGSEEEQRKREKWRMQNAIDTAGLSQGIEQNKKEITKKMLNENIDINTISRLTGLTKEEIESLR